MTETRTEIQTCRGARLTRETKILHQGGLKFTREFLKNHQVPGRAKFHQGGQNNLPGRVPPGLWQRGVLTCDTSAKLSLGCSPRCTKQNFILLYATILATPQVFLQSLRCHGLLHKITPPHESVKTCKKSYAKQGFLVYKNSAHQFSAGFSTV